MTSAEIRKSFLDFFREKKHTIVPSSSLLPDSPNLLFTNAGMNQFVPIFLGQQKPPWNPPRVADTQKCIRAGGKHNDLEDVGLDTYHLTFFEMLGNWSFGDYFKKEAIEWAWELVVERWGLPPQRLYATVYKPGPGEPSEFDQEAHDHWARLFQEADLDPKIHIVNGNKKDNFWMMGDTGPCGPCSELHVDLTPDGDTRGALVNKEDPRCIEIWNLVFIQFNANADGSFTPLPQRHVDTGMGFERMSGFYAATKGFTDFNAIPSAYDADVFTDLFRALEELSRKKYGSTIPKHGSTGETDQEKIDIAFRVIADHIRALTFAIADGIIPSNEGRGYVLRRILRRAVRYGRTLGFHEPFFFKLVDVVANAMGDVFPEVRAKQSKIKETIKREEEAFNKTLDKGIRLFEQATAGLTAGEAGANVTSMILEKEFAQELGTKSVSVLAGKTIRGKFAFMLYDTYGFPLDLTQLMARERGLTVDVAGFEKLMEEQRSRARAAQKKSAIEISKIDGKTPTNFLGYEEDHTGANVEAIVDLSDKHGVILNNSVCYAEMGGQVGDTGEIVGKDRQWRIANTQKSGTTFVHVIESDDAPGINEHVTVKLDIPRRRAIERHHTVTHILHWALHEKVSRDAAQKGSYVGPDKLTFDFSSAALSPEQKRKVEKLVNEKVAEDAPVSWREIPYAEAKKRSDIQQFFGDKYGETVRVVQIGGDAKALNGYSMELCGGTHVRSTSEIGAFRIVREEAIAAGIRRIEAVAGDAARDWAQQEATKQQERFETLARKKPDIPTLPAFSSKGETSEMLKQLDTRAAHLEKVDVDVREWEKKNAKASGAELKGRAAEIAKELLATHAKKNSVVAEVKNADGKLLQAVADALKPKIKTPIFLAGVANGRVALIASVPKELTAKFQADKLMQQLAPIVGGKGGGRGENAQGAGNDPGKIDTVLAEAEKLIAQIK
jgi:alanyl-tRNA synthetase